MFKDIVVVVVLALILGLSMTYIIKKKKQGVKCIGCPNAQSCAKKTCNTTEM